MFVGKYIAAFPLLIFDLGKYLYGNLAITSSHLNKLFGGKDLNHEMTSLAREKRKQAQTSFAT